MTCEESAKPEHTSQAEESNEAPVAVIVFKFHDQYSYVTVHLRGKNGQSEFMVKGNLPRAGIVGTKCILFCRKRGIWEEESDLFVVFMVQDSRRGVIGQPLCMATRLFSSQRLVARTQAKIHDQAAEEPSESERRFSGRDGGDAAVRALAAKIDP